MSIECSECERDLRGGHADDCPRFVKPPSKCLGCGTELAEVNVPSTYRKMGMRKCCQCVRTAEWEPTP